MTSLEGYLFIRPLTLNKYRQCVLYIVWNPFPKGHWYSDQPVWALVNIVLESLFADLRMDELSIGTVINLCGH